jgi:hypothetical protein
VSVLPFRRRAPIQSAPSHTAEVRLSDQLRAANGLPSWVIAEGYTPVGIRRPEVGEYFFCPVRQKVLKCAEDIEEQPFVILVYGGAP